MSRLTKQALSRLVVALFAAVLLWAVPAAHAQNNPSPNPLNFASVKVGKSTTAYLLQGYTANELSKTISSITITGPNASNFTVVSEGVIMIGAQKLWQAQLKCTPSGTGARNATLTITGTVTTTSGTSSYTATVALKGTGT